MSTGMSETCSKRFFQMGGQYRVFRKPGRSTGAIARGFLLQQFFCERGNRRRHFLQHHRITSRGWVARNGALFQHVAKLHHFAATVRFGNSKPDRPEISRHIGNVVFLELLFRNGSVIRQPFQAKHAHYVSFRFLETGKVSANRLADIFLTLAVRE